MASLVSCGKDARASCTLPRLNKNHAKVVAKLLAFAGFVVLSFRGVELARAELF